MISNDKYKKYYIHNYQETDKAYGLYIKRSDGVQLYKPEWFAKSVVNTISKSNSQLVIEIPIWLLKKKLSYGFYISED